MDNTLKIYDPVANTLSASLHTFTTPSPQYQYVSSDADGVNLFFEDGPLSLYRVPLDGSTTSTLLVTENSGSSQYDFLYLADVTDNNLFYVLYQGASSASTLKTVPKIGGMALTIATSTSFFSTTAVGTRLYYNVVTGTSPAQTTTAKVVKEDGTVETSIPNADWVGEARGTVYTPGGSDNILRIILVEGMTGLSAANGTLKSVDAKTGNAITAITLGTVPSDINNLRLYGRGDHLFGESRQGNGSPYDPNFKSDIFFANPTIANSLFRVTNTPTIYERLP